LVYGAMTPEQKSEAEQLVKQLGAKGEETREAATKKLIEMGPDVAGMVRAELERTVDPEVKKACEQVLSDVRLVEKRVKLLGRIPEGGDGLQVSPDGKHMACIVMRGEKRTFWLDGKESEAYDRMSMVWFSEDWQHVFYSAEQGEKRFVVKDGKRGPDFGMVSDLMMSEDGLRTAYIASEGGKISRVIDGEPGPWETPEEFWGGAMISNRGEHVAYGVMRGDKWCLVVDGKEGPMFEMVSMCFFSADGKHVQYEVKDEQGWHYVVDGKVGPAHTRLVWGEFSPDGKEHVYAAEDRGSCTLMRGGKSGPRYAEIEMLKFSPDGRKLAYVTRNGKGKDRMVVDGQEGPVFWRIMSEAEFSEDGSHMSYWARGKDLSQPMVRICDEMVWTPREKVWGYAAFSGDGQHICIPVSRRETRGRYVVVDGIEGPVHQEIEMFPDSRKGKSLRYVIRDEEEVWLVEVAWPEGLDWRNGMVKIK